MTVRVMGNLNRTNLNHLPVRAACSHFHWHLTPVAYGESDLPLFVISGNRIIKKFFFILDITFTRELISKTL